MITLALSKGRILDETLPLLAAAGIALAENPETSRRLIVATSRPDLRIVLVRASDVPTYVQHGGADLGVVGLDTLIEHGGLLNFATWYADYFAIRAGDGVSKYAGFGFPHQSTADVHHAFGNDSLNCQGRTPLARHARRIVASTA